MLELKRTVYNGLAMGLCLVLVSCYNIPQVPGNLPEVSGGAKLPPLELLEKNEPEKYIYTGASFQDPFLQLEKDNMVIVHKEMLKGEIDPAILLLKGIIRGGGKPIALLADTAGNAYFVKKMRLVDFKGRVIPGVVGIVKEDSVIIETQDGVSREIRLYE